MYERARLFCHDLRALIREILSKNLSEGCFGCRWMKYRLFLSQISSLYVSKIPLGCSNRFVPQEKGICGNSDHERDPSSEAMTQKLLSPKSFAPLDQQSESHQSMCWKLIILISNMNSFFCLFVCFVFLPFLGWLLQHMGVPRPGVELELQPPAYARATATRDQSRIYNLHHSSRQRRILNPLNKGRDRTRNLMVPGRIR